MRVVPFVAALGIAACGTAGAEPEPHGAEPPPQQREQPPSAAESTTTTVAVAADDAQPEAGAEQSTAAIEVLAELPDPNGVGGIFAPTEHVLDPFFPAADSFPAGWDVVIDDSYSGETGQEGCPPSFAFAEFLDWMEREVVTGDDTTAQITMAAGIAPYGSDAVTALTEIASFGQCALDGLPTLTVVDVPPPDDVTTLTALVFEEGELRGDWYGMAFGDGIVAELFVATAGDSEFDGGAWLATFASGIESARDRIAACTETRTLLHDGRIAEATTPLELCGGWDHWHVERVLLPLADEES